MDMTRLGVTVRYALIDLVHERRVSLLTVFLQAAFLTPVLLLHILKFGVISAWTEDLSRDTRNREVRVSGEYALSAEDIAAIAAWDEVGYVVAEPSHLITTQPMRRIVPKRGPVADVNIRTSTAGDPALGPTAPAPKGRDVVFSFRMAQALEVAAGDQVTVLLRRQPRDAPVETFRLPLRVTAVLDEPVWVEKNAFLDPNTARDIGDWLEFSLSDAEAIGSTSLTGQVRWRSLRVYAPTVRLAPALLGRLAEAGFDPQVRSDQVNRLVSTEDGLSKLFVILLSITACSFAGTMFLLQWQGVERKKRDIALLVAVGFQRSEIVLFPVIQSFVLGLAGTVAGVLLALALAQSLQLTLATQLSLTGIVSPPLWHFAVAGASTVLIGGAASAFAARAIGGLNILDLLRSD
jgi:putative ABC transport system permease protein